VREIDRTLIAGAVMLSCSLAGVAAELEDVPAIINGAIQKMRGLKVEGMAEADRSPILKPLDDAWKVLMDHPKESTKALREALDKERDDHFFLIDGSRLMLNLDEGKTPLADLTRWLTPVNPNAFDGGFFDIVSYMAASRCEECKPVVLKMLELKKLDAFIVQHALPVDIDLGLVFTIGQYGDSAIPLVLGKLDSSECAERGNAAYALGILLPGKEPAKIRRMATEDTCLEARVKAWQALGGFHDPEVVPMAGKELAAVPPPDAREREFIAEALGSSDAGAAKDLLKKLAADADPNVSAYAAKVLEAADKGGGGRGAGHVSRSSLLSELHEAVKKGRFDENEKMLRKNLGAALTIEDLPLLNEARAAVLSRLSDECLYEYFPLTLAAGEIRGREGTVGD
jgi:hypothetical protein